MKRIALLLALAVPTTAILAQTPTTPAPKTTTTAKPAVHKPVTPAASAVKLPPGVPPARGILHTAFALKYQDIKLGTGADAEPNKLYEVKYTGWRAADGVKFDASEDHKQPVLDKDGKPEKDADGKPKMGDAAPFKFPQGQGRLIPGWDQGFGGMKVGGKRRLFIPWQLAYGTREIPARAADHPGIPAKSDLIFDVELVSVAEMPQRPGGPGGMAPGAAGGRTMPRPSGAPPAPGGAPGMAPLPTKPVTPTTPSSNPTPSPSGAPAAAPAPAVPAPSPAAPSTPAPSPAATPAPTTPPPAAAPAPTPAPQTK